MCDYKNVNNQHLVENDISGSVAEGIERGCDTMLMCIITTLTNGLRNGGGIGDVLRKPKSTVIIYIYML